MKIRADILRADLKRSRRLFEEGADKMHSDGGRAILRHLTDATRVDTGKAVSNWRVGIGQPTRAVIEAYQAGKKGSTAGANRSMALGAGLARISTKKPGNEIFISNNVDYQEYIPRFQETVDNAITAGRMAIENRKVL